MKKSIDVIFTQLVKCTIPGDTAINEIDVEAIFNQFQDFKRQSWTLFINFNPCIHHTRGICNSFKCNMNDRSIFGFRRN